jgi:NAD-dependent deacetylase
MESNLLEQGSDFILITQNVDGFHQQAGSQKLIELHGNIHRSKCFDCSTIASAKKAIGKMPRCAHCGGLLRPDVVWFGESLSPDTLQAAWNVAENCDVFFSIGTSAAVQPAASLPVIALQKGATVIEINPNPTQISILAAFILQGPSGEVLPELISTVWPITG